jgi:hypothetical protein
MTQNKRRMWLGWDIGIVVLVLGLAACGRFMATDAYLDLQIVQVQVLSGGDCTVPGSATASHRTAGTLDLGLPDQSLPPYYLPVLIANNLASVGGSIGDEYNDIELTHFTVELSAPNVVWSSACPARFDTESFTDLITPGSSVGAGLNIITPAHSRCILPYVTSEHLVVSAKVWAKGRHGGTTIESAPLVYPVDVCTGCLQKAYYEPTLAVYRYPADYPLCSALSGANPYTGDPCLPPGQDETILCCGVTTSVGGVTQPVALCPGAFTGGTSTTTSTTP